MIRLEAPKIFPVSEECLVGSGTKSHWRFEVKNKRIDANKTRIESNGKLGKSAFWFSTSGKKYDSRIPSFSNRMPLFSSA
uniref:Uncharacterized protein n=1 Tax=Candidatus Kentrum sp. TC TaxID=2126339 RepID=A0A450YDQ3_9GAMM|nr:MAG: hypothetical protein BECKTC1821D_GA0114238_10044 [Candidatus Kentron sp. TC]VFK39678.1 MAG: hypothetical protein BECKTC1821E_GA0114239_10056 [Candidatus Kentron sp. TC]VFK54315.1 MAG: hypothetical protein BECKTC1821F_GA0114240_1004118 [Candidatus Kentron sp. TC]